MLLDISFSHLLTSILCIHGLSALGVDARPTNFSARTVSVPLKRVAENVDELHPLVHLQRHVNRGHRRLARMKGLAAVSPEESRINLQRRMYLLNSTSTDDREWYLVSEYMKDPSIAKSKKSPANSLSESNFRTRQAAGGTSLAEGISTSENQPGIPLINIVAAVKHTIAPAQNSSDPNSIGLDIEANDVGYFANIQLGTPPRSFRILMDSGSSDFWVGGENCQSTDGGDCGPHTYLGPQSSSSLVSTNKPFQVTYGKGAVAGEIVQDNALIGDLPLNGLTFGIATTETPDFSDASTPFDGLMGLGKSSLSNQGVPTPIDVLAAENKVSQAVTSFKLGRVSDGINDGLITFGGLDETKFNPNTRVTFKNVNPDGFWEGALDQVTVGGQDIGLNGRTGILDTGTSLIIVPADDALAIHNAIPGAVTDGQGNFAFPCDTTTQVALGFGGRSFAINSTDMLFTAVNLQNFQNLCTSGITAGQVGGPQEWLIGDVFLKNAYFSVDTDNNEISLAELA